MRRSEHEIPPRENLPTHPFNWSFTTMTVVSFRRFAITLAAFFTCVLSAHSARGAAMATSAPSLGFTTSGQIGTEGVSGFNALSFLSQSQPIWGTTGSRYLGQFISAPLPPGVTTTYQNTPFSISILPTGLNYEDTWYTKDLQPIVLKGRLNGTLSAGGFSNIVASFDPIDPWVDIVKGGIKGTETFLTGIGPFLVGGAGSTNVMMNWALLTASPVPEPSTLVVIASGLTLACFARRRRWI